MCFKLDYYLYLSFLSLLLSLRSAELSSCVWSFQQTNGSAAIATLNTGLYQRLNLKVCEGGRVFCPRTYVSNLYCEK